MDTSDSIRRFLQDGTGLNAAPAVFTALDRLAGQTFGQARFHANLAEARAAITPEMPIYFLPIGEDVFRMGIHLRPTDVAAGRVAIVRYGAMHDFIEVACSLEQFVFRALLEAEGHIHEGQSDPSFKDAVARANAIFGEGFYAFGRLGEFMAADVDLKMIKLFGGTPAALAQAAFTTRRPDRKRQAFEQGARLEPKCMVMHAGLAQLDDQIGDVKAASNAAAASLRCYHHTIYTVEIAEHLRRCADLLKSHPDSFSAAERFVIEHPNPEDRARRVVELWEMGDASAAEKMLCDAAYELRAYGHFVSFLGAIYEKLGWEWAVALCDIRTT